MAERLVTRFRSTKAWCDDCDFYTEGRGAVGRGRYHHDVTGHVVYTKTSRMATYGKKTHDD